MLTPFNSSSVCVCVLLCHTRVRMLAAADSVGADSHMPVQRETYHSLKRGSLAYLVNQFLSCHSCGVYGLQHVGSQDSGQYRTMELAVR